MSRGRIDVAVIPADASQPVEFTTIGNDLPTLQAIVGGHVETVTTPTAVLVCNEDGKVVGLPMNRRATRLWFELAGHDFQLLDFLTGPVVVTGTVLGEDLTSVASVVEAAIEGLGT